MDAASFFLTSCFYVRIYHANFIQSKNIYLMLFLASQKIKINIQYPSLVKKVPTPNKTSNPPSLNAIWKTAKSIKQSHNKHLQQTFAADLLLKQ